MYLIYLFVSTSPCYIIDSKTQPPNSVAPHSRVKLDHENVGRCGTQTTGRVVQAAEERGADR